MTDSSLARNLTPEPYGGPPPMWRQPLAAPASRQPMAPLARATEQPEADDESGDPSTTVGALLADSAEPEDRTEIAEAADPVEPEGRAEIVESAPLAGPEAESPPALIEKLGPTGRVLPVFPTPPPLTSHGPARVIALCNQKGGVGKTTAAINLGAALAELGRRVLLVDFDPQGSMSVGLGVAPHELELSVYNLLLQRDVTLRDVVRPTRVRGMDLVPANIDLSAAEMQLVNEVAREQVLQQVLRPAMRDYDVILIDCQPSLGLLTINALTAADGVIVPMECEFFALRGLAMLTETIDKVQQRLNPDLRIEGILATMYDSRTIHTREVLTRVVERFGDTVFHTVINRTIRFPETTVAGEPITTYDSASAGAAAFRQLAVEVLARAAAAAEPAGGDAQ